MQMSRAQLFVFVEGRIDRFFYSRLCETALAEFGLLYELAMAQELPGAIGGKPGLLTFYSYLEFKTALLDEFKGKSLAAVFFLDKDLDDYTRAMQPEPHAVYTHFYEVENLLFNYGLLTNSVAAAAELDLPTVRAHFGNQSTWLRHCVDAWRIWTKMCAFSQVRRARCICTYRANSQVNSFTWGPVDAALVSTHMRILEQASGMSPQKFARAFGRIGRWVDGKYDSGLPDSVFKGKWYRGFVASAFPSAAAGRAYNANGLEDRVTANLAMSVDPTAPWASRFVDPVRVIAASLMQIAAPQLPPPVVEVPTTSLVRRIQQAVSSFFAKLFPGSR